MISCNSPRFRTFAAGAGLLASVLAALLAGAGTSQVQPTTKSNDSSKDTAFEDSALEVMNDKMTREVLDAVTHLAEWRNQFKDIQTFAGNVQKLIKSRPDAAAKEKEVLAWIKQANALLQSVPDLRPLADDLDNQVRAAKDAAATASDLAALYEKGLATAVPKLVTATVTSVEKVLSDKYPQVQKFLGYASDIEMKLAAARRDMQKALKLAQDYQDQVLNGIEKLRDPANLTKTLLAGKIADLVKRPIQIDDVTFQIANPEQVLAKSVFSKNPGIDIKIVYLDKLEVKASGLYFRKDGTLVFDNLKVTSNLESVLKNAALTSLGDTIPSFGDNAPFKLTFQKFLGFEKTNGRRAGIKFDIELKFIDFLPGLTGTGLILYPTKGGDVVLPPDGMLKYRDPSNTPYQIGTSGLAFYGYEISFNPKSSSTAQWSAVDNASDYLYPFGDRCAQIFVSPNPARRYDRR